jgi:hypothetical protein
MVRGVMAVIEGKGVTGKRRTILVRALSCTSPLRLVSLVTPEPKRWESPFCELRSDHALNWPIVVPARG